MVERCQACPSTLSPTRRQHKSAPRGATQLTIEDSNGGADVNDPGSDRLVAARSKDAPGHGHQGWRSSETASTVAGSRTIDQSISW